LIDRSSLQTNVLPEFEVALLRQSPLIFGFN